MAGKKQTTELANYDAELAKLAQMGRKTASVMASTGGKTIGTQGASFTIDNKTLKAGTDGRKTLDVVVGDFILVNAFYTPGVKFDPKNPTSPICYAYGRTEDEMVAHPEATVPQGGTKYEPKGGQPGRSCVGCWANEWESADQGKGKACKNGFRLGLITADSIKSAESIDKAETRFLPVPPTSGKFWNAHTASVEDTFDLPVLGVVTEVEILPSEGGGHELHFETLQEVDKGVIGALLKKHQKIAKEIDFPFMKPDPKAADGAKGKRTPAKAPAKSAGRASSADMGLRMAGKATTPATKRTTKY